MARSLAIPLRYGFLAVGGLLGLYFAVLSLVSGWDFAQSQFLLYWYFIIPLALGFGTQVGLYVRLRQLMVADRGGGTVVGMTGTASTAAMVSCCAHYLTNVLPMLGAVGIVTFVVQYQTELFWVGLLFNLGGIAYLGNKVLRSRSV